MPYRQYYETLRDGKRIKLYTYPNLYIHSAVQSHIYKEYISNAWLLAKGMGK